METYWDLWRLTESYVDSHRLTEPCWDLLRLAETCLNHTDSQRLVETRRGSQRLAETRRDSCSVHIMLAYNVTTLIWQVCIGKQKVKMLGPPYISSPFWLLLAIYPSRHSNVGPLCLSWRKLVCFYSDVWWHYSKACF